MRRTMVWAGLLLITAIGQVRADGDPSPPPAGNRVGPIAPRLAPPVAGDPVLTPESLSSAAGYGGAFPPDPVPALPDVGPPRRPADDLLNNRLSTPFATPTAGGGYQGRSLNDEFDGDFPGIFYTRTVQIGTTTQRVQIGTTTQQVQVGTQQIVVTDPQTGQLRPITVPVFQTITSPVFGNVTVPVTRRVRVPVAGRYSGIMITDNDSPRPGDRLYFGYSYYNALGSSLNPGFGNTTQHREMIGFEKTVFGGDASFGMRLPSIQLNAPLGTGGSTVGDLSLTFKWAPIYNRETGDILALGVVLTTPTSSSGGTLSNGTSIPHSVLFQPWLGFVHTFGRGYIQGISNFLIPTDNRDTYLWGNSIALGYRVVEGNGLLPAISPTFEVHVRTPLNNVNPNGLVYLQDQVNLTGGVHMRWNRVSLNGAACIPVVGPRPWDIEAIANLNFRF